MEATSLSIPSADDSAGQYAAALRLQRQRVREFLSAQQERLRAPKRSCPNSCSASRPSWLPTVVKLSRLGKNSRSVPRSFSSKPARWHR